MRTTTLRVNTANHELSMDSRLTLLDALHNVECGLSRDRKAGRVVADHHRENANRPGMSFLRSEHPFAREAACSGTGGDHG